MTLKICQGQNLQKCSFLKHGYFFKKTSNIADGNKKIPRISELGSNTAIDYRLCFQNFAQFSIFPGRVENKKEYRYVSLLNIFKNVLQIMIGVFELYKKIAARQGLPHNSVFLFPGGKWVAWKKVKTSNISGTLPSILFNLSSCVQENNGLLNKNY